MVTVGLHLLYSRYRKNGVVLPLQQIRLDFSWNIDLRSSVVTLDIAFLPLSMTSLFHYLKSKKKIEAFRSRGVPR